MDVIAVDVYNMATSKNVFKTLNSVATDSDHIPVICLNDQGGGVMDVSDKAGTLRAQEHGHQPIACFQVESIGHDLRSTQFSRGGCCDTLTANDFKEPGIVCYSLKGNFIDRETKQNGRGWKKDVSYTMDATDRHGVCYGISRSMLKGGMNAGGMPCEKDKQQAITANGTGAVCYESLPDNNRSLVCEQPSG